MERWRGEVVIGGHLSLVGGGHRVRGHGMVVVVIIVLVVMVVVVIVVCGHAGGHFDCGTHCLVVTWRCHIGVADVSGCGIGRERSLMVVGGCRWQWAAVGGSRQCWVWAVVLSQGVSSCGMVVVEGQDAQTSTQTTSTHIQHTEHAE